MWHATWLLRREQDRERAARARRQVAHRLWARVHGAPPLSWPPDVVHLTLYTEANAAANASEDGAA